MVDNKYEKAHVIVWHGYLYQRGVIDIKTEYIIAIVKMSTLC